MGYLCLGSCVKYIILAIINFCSFYTEEEKIYLETVASMLSYGALERCNNLYIAQCVDPCVSKN